MADVIAMTSTFEVERDPSLEATKSTEIFHWECQKIDWTPM